MDSVIEDDALDLDQARMEMPANMLFPDLRSQIDGHEIETMIARLCARTSSKVRIHELRSRGSVQRNLPLRLPNNLLDET